MASYAGPGLALLQAQAYADAAGAEDGQGGSDGVDGQRDEVGEGLLPVHDQMHAAAEEDQSEGGDQEKCSENHPEHAERVEMALQTGAGDGADGVSELAVALRAGYGVGWNLGAAAIAEHGEPPEYGTWKLM